MNLPVCFSLNFVNKQNVRSFGNIIPVKILKKENGKTYLQHVLEENVTNASAELKNLLFKLQRNLNDKTKDDFKRYFQNIKFIEDKSLKPVTKEEVYNCCLNALPDIVPSNLFGSNHNKRIFQKLVRMIVYSMNRQYIILSKQLSKWDYSVSPWSSIDPSKSGVVLEKIIVWIGKYVLSSMIALNFYVSTCKVDSDEHKLHFFMKNEWQRFTDSRIAKMIKARVIEKFNPYCMGKKVKCFKDYTEKKRMRKTVKEIPKLHLILKTKNYFRPIVRYKSEHCVKEKYKIRTRLNFIKELNQRENERIETKFHNLYKQWTNNMKPKLYFVKTDLSNAFGSINKPELMKILSEKHCALQKTEQNLLVKRKYAQQYKDLVAELRKPLLVRAGSTVYEWRRGLVQGYKYSPALSELYYSYYDKLYFTELMKRNEEQISFFIRVVDDYLFISESLDKAKDFLNALSNYRNVNYEKTVVSFPHSDIKFSDQISFLGYNYNTNTLEVSRASTIFAGQMCYKISFSAAITDISLFIENRIGQSGITVSGHIFNLYHNDEELLWKHIFTTLCLSANKFCTIISILCNPDEIKQHLCIYKKRVAIKLNNSIIDMVKRNKPMDLRFMYCINHFRYLSFKALLLCARKTAKCSELVPLINIELSKCNCIFGKWKEHFSRIETNGEMKSSACRDVCRRTDLRIIFSKMDSLPNGFECYNSKKI